MLFLLGGLGLTLFFLGGWFRVTSLFKPRESAIASSEEQAEINIFTVASGLLYEVRKNAFIFIFSSGGELIFV